MSLSLLLSALLLALASTVTATVPTPSANAVHLTLLHLNDCYELMPAGGTDLGGVSRVATLRKQLLAANPNTFTMLAGDLFSPSALGSTPIPNVQGGIPYNGLQMVAGMNALGLDYACLGNHETDVKVAPFRKNLAASNFTWLSANARNFNYPNLNKSVIVESKPDASNGRTVKLGIVGLTIDSNNKDYESYFNFTYSSTAVADSEIANLNAQGADVVIGLTHWAASEDQTWVTQSTTDVALVLGGHEHSVIRIETPGYAPIYKADSNVKSVWIHELWIDPTVPKSDPTHCIHEPRLVMINASLDMDPTAQAIVQPYLDAAFASYAVSGFNVSLPVCLLSQPMDLRSQALATGPTLGSSMFAEAIYRSATFQLAQANSTIGAVDLAIMNVGTLRPDDILSAGTLLSQYDVLRIAPFLNLVSACQISGSLLQQVLNIGIAQAYNSASGFYSSQFLAWSNVSYTTNTGASPTYNWFINGAPLSVNRNYTLAATDYLIGLGNTAGPSPFGILNTVASPHDFAILFEGTKQSIAADPRIFFTKELMERFPLPYTPPPPPPATGPRARVTFLLALPFLSVSNFTSRLPRDISLALQIRLERVTLVSLSSQDPNTQVTFLIAPNTSPDPISAQEAADSFVTQSLTAGSALFQQASLAKTVAGSVSVEMIDTGSSSTGGARCPDGSVCAATMSRCVGREMAMMLIALAVAAANI